MGNEHLRDILKKLRIGKELTKKISELIINDFFDEYKNIKLCKGFNRIRRIKKRKIIISNNIKGFIEKPLSFLKVDFFEEIYGSEDFKTKENLIRKIVKRDELKKEDIIYIGDTVRDIEVVKNIGCFSVVVSNKCSWSNREKLLEEKPDFIINELSGLSKIIKRLES